MGRIDKKFRELKAANKKAFVPFVTAGYPDFATTEKLVLEFEKNGADVIELGVPFSDPIADGPVIQKSSEEALKRGATLRKVLHLVARLRRATQMPLAAMSYFNPILSYGPLVFVRDAIRCGLDAVIVPDLPPEEEREFSEAAAQAGLDIIVFAAPTTPADRARVLIRAARGFVYFVSLTGVTGQRRDLPPDLRQRLVSFKKMAGALPVCAGFGVSTPAQVRYVASLCDGVIVGSAIIEQITKNMGRPDMVKRVGAFVGKLRRGF